MNLVAIEVRRMRARRILVIFFGAAVIGIAVAGVLTFVRSSQARPTPNVFVVPDEAMPAFDQCMNESRFGPGPPVAEPSAVPVPGDIQERAAECERLFGVRTFAGDRRFHLTKLKDVFGGTTVPLALAAWVLGASFAGAEWKAGTVTTLLTWEPRRARVLVAKATVAVLTGVALAVALQAFLGTALLPSAFLRGTTEGAGAAWAGAAIGVVLRGALLAGVAGGIGFSLGWLGRNTAAALGVGFVYLAIVESVLGNIFPWIRRWLLIGNSIVLVTGERDAGDVFGRGRVGAGVLLAAYAAALVAMASAAFRARDVT